MYGKFHAVPLKNLLTSAASLRFVQEKWTWNDKWPDVFCCFANLKKYNYVNTMLQKNDVSLNENNEN